MYASSCVLSPLDKYICLVFFSSVSFYNNKKYVFIITKSTSSRFSVLSGSCLTAGGHAASFINQVCIMLVNSFTIPGCITNGVGGSGSTSLCFLMLQSMRYDHVLFRGALGPLLCPSY